MFSVKFNLFLIKLSWLELQPSASAVILSRPANFELDEKWKYCPSWCWFIDAEMGLSFCTMCHGYLTQGRQSLPFRSIFYIPAHFTKNGLNSVWRLEWILFFYATNICISHLWPLQPQISDQLWSNIDGNPQSELWLILISKLGIQIEPGPVAPSLIIDW